MKSNAEIQELNARLHANRDNDWMKGVREHMDRFKKPAVANDPFDAKEARRIMTEMKEMAEAIAEVKSDFQQFETGAQKQTGNKLRLDLVRPSLEEGVAEVLGFGASKYGDRNWEKGIPYLTVLAAARRHINQFIKGENLDHESGLSHIKHAVCNLAFLLEFIAKDRKDLDNRGE